LPEARIVVREILVLKEQGHQPNAQALQGGHILATLIYNAVGIRYVNLDAAVGLIGRGPWHYEQHPCGNLCVRIDRLGKVDGRTNYLALTTPSQKEQALRTVRNSALAARSVGYDI
jgi:hypothetical protein